MGGGLGFSALRASAREARTRDTLLQSATAAVRALHPELNRILDDQVRAIEDALGDLGEERASAWAEGRREAREALERQATARRDRIDALQRRHDDLVAEIAALWEEPP